ncbi:hypothetical protein ACQKNX_04635 [Lysinibacillus sp. NPDC093712]|uniref:hypothetical protein n=1 Tax=Lysinibacillus sp. NPDC093712 TaxID=3390579 RepID=UPI003D0664A3
MRKLFFMLTCLVLLFFFTGNIAFNASTVVAAEQNADFAITILNESTMRLELLNDETTIENDEVGNIIVKKGDYSEVLPTQAIDSNGNEVNLIYKSVDNGLIIELHNGEQPIQTTTLARSKWKCALGVLGGYYLGAITGLGVGIGAGTVLPGIGNAVGAVGGAIVGAAGGAMSGASSSCFD